MNFQFHLEVWEISVILFYVCISPNQFTIAIFIDVYTTKTLECFLVEEYVERVLPTFVVVSHDTRSLFLVVFMKGEVRIVVHFMIFISALHHHFRAQRSLWNSCGGDAQRFDCTFSNNVVSVTCSFDEGEEEDCSLPLVLYNN